MKLKNIVPWGRTLEEYKEMFLLDEDDLQKNILGCGDGPASFNAELSSLGGSVVSVDPIYAFSKEELSSRIDEVAKEVMVQVRKNEETFVWKNIKNPDELYTIRMRAMRSFLDDYEQGLKEGRYMDEMLPSLSFVENQFDLVLSSHFLFLYSEHLDFEFHFNAVMEMIRVAKEVRIFPLMTLKNEYSPHLFKIIESLELQGYMAQIVKTDYEFQKGANEMLVVKPDTQSLFQSTFSKLIF